MFAAAGDDVPHAARGAFLGVGDRGGVAGIEGDDDLVGGEQYFPASGMRPTTT
jgi:hypothetical protein